MIVPFSSDRVNVKGEAREGFPEGLLACRNLSRWNASPRESPPYENIVISSMSERMVGELDISSFRQESRIKERANEKAMKDGAGGGNREGEGKKRRVAI